MRHNESSNNLVIYISGMRADWILTDEERTNKRQKIEENRRLRQMLYPDSNDVERKNETE